MDTVTADHEVEVFAGAVRKLNFDTGVGLFESFNLIAKDVRSAIHAVAVQDICEVATKYLNVASQELAWDDGLQDVVGVDDSPVG